MFKKQPFGATIPPSCEYCQHGRLSSNGKMILCEKKGVVSPYYHCKRYIYDPIARVPKRMPKLPTFSAEDFSLY